MSRYTAQRRAARKWEMFRLKTCRIAYVLGRNGHMNEEKETKDISKVGGMDVAQLFSYRGMSHTFQTSGNLPVPRIEGKQDAPKALPRVFDRCALVYHQVEQARLEISSLVLRSPVQCFRLSSITIGRWVQSDCASTCLLLQLYPDSIYGRVNSNTKYCILP